MDCAAGIAACDAMDAEEMETDRSPCNQYWRMVLLVGVGKTNGPIGQWLNAPFGNFCGIAFGMAVLCSLLCHSLYTWSLEFINPTLLAIFKILAPIPTAVLGFLVFGEMPTGNQVVGGMIVIVGICVYTLYASKTEKE